MSDSESGCPLFNFFSDIYFRHQWIKISIDFQFLFLPTFLLFLSAFKESIIDMAKFTILTTSKCTFLSNIKYLHIVSQPPSISTFSYFLTGTLYPYSFSIHPFSQLLAIVFLFYPDFQ